MNYLITGGERSGKSSFGQKLALKLSLELSSDPIYLATSRIWDHDFAERIQRHKSDRDSRWKNLEIEKYISQISFRDEVILVDCITLWLTNFFSDHHYQVEPSLEESKKEMIKVLGIPNQYIFITNEIGMGVHAETEAGRKFTELQGWFNQFLAQKVDQVYFMVSGIPMKIK